VILLNNDTRVEAGFVKGLYDAIRKDEKIFSVSAKMLMWDKPELLDEMRETATAFWDGHIPGEKAGLLWIMTRMSAYSQPVAERQFTDDIIGRRKFRFPGIVAGSRRSTAVMQNGCRRLVPVLIAVDPGGKLYLKGLAEGWKRTVGPVGKQAKVRFQWSHLWNYVKIQWQLYLNVFRILMKS